MKSLILFVVAANFFLAACASDTASSIASATDTSSVEAGDSLKKPEAKGEFIDSRDGHRYGWVQVGSVRVMTSNLSYRPKHGNIYVYTDNGYDSARSIVKFGYAYDYEAMIDSTPPRDGYPLTQGACPEGWWIPSSYDWKALVQRPLNVKTGKNSPSTDRIFNQWSFFTEDGGDNSLGLTFSQSYGTDFDCDTSIYFADSLSNCKENKRFVVSYAVADTFSYIGDVGEKNIIPASVKRRYNVYKLGAGFSSTGISAIGYGNSFIRRDFADFSYIRCFQNTEVGAE